MNTPSNAKAKPLRLPTKPFAARLSAPAHERIHARASEAGVSAREWLERAILEEQAKIIAKSKPHPDLSALLFQVNRAGNNLNQLAHHFNAMVYERELNIADIHQANLLLKQIKDLLSEALNNAR